eukprot:203543-Chlamydomonas_euryale.AAC.3
MRATFRGCCPAARAAARPRLIRPSRRQAVRRGPHSRLRHGRARQVASLAVGGMTPLGLQHVGDSHTPTETSGNPALPRPYCGSRPAADDSTLSNLKARGARTNAAVSKARARTPRGAASAPPSAPFASLPARPARIGSASAHSAAAGNAARLSGTQPVNVLAGLYAAACAA